MNSLIKSALAIALFVGAASPAFAGNVVLVNADIAVATVWTNDNVYRLQDQIYVLPGASLTIEAGTLIASNTGVGGSLAVTAGAQIFIQGTRNNPVVMTSTADTATWDSIPCPLTAPLPCGEWREGVNEWGNLTLMGRAYISEDAVVTNMPKPDAANRANMEGLVAAFPGDPNVQYGGGNDDDDSGSISYLSLRYGGRVIGLNNELNGMSLGGIGRSTDIHHVEIMNNVDDGFEIWGGTLNLKYFSIWNVGDDSLDVDQGWRGKAQFGLIVQGYSEDAPQGSGVGDNCFEVDGAEDSNYQPVTTASIYNCTVIGQPVDGDCGTAWRDNARVQYRKCIFMDLGDRLVCFDNVDGDGGNGYGFGGTLTWAQTWMTPAGACSLVNPPMAPLTCADLYQAQRLDGNLAEIRDSVFFRNLKLNAYDEAIARGVFDPGMNNVLIGGFDDLFSPITCLERDDAVSVGGKIMLRVTKLDPRPRFQAAHAAESNGPVDGFFDAVNYRGAFAPGRKSTNWLCGWTAADQYKFVCNFGKLAPEPRDGLEPGSPGPQTPGAGSLPAAGDKDVL